MNAITVVQRTLASARRLCDSAMLDITEDQFNWTPPGTANPISSTFIHICSAEDFYAQAVLQAKPRLFDEQGWQERLGAPAPGRGKGWDEVKASRVALRPALDLATEVRATTDAYLATLSDADLDREVTFIGGMRPVTDVFATMAAHMAGHAGEIAALRGIQGVKGLPF